MLNSIQSQRRIGPLLLVVALIATVIAASRPENSVVFYFLAVALLQSFFNLRRTWLVYAPLSALLAIPFNIMVSDSAATRIYSWLFGAVLMILLIVGGLSELVLALYRRRQLKSYTKQVNQANTDGQLFFNDNALHAAGLNDAERSFFKKQVRKHYQQVQLLTGLRLQAQTLIPSYNDDLKLIDSIFRELVSAPQQMLQIDNFLYQHLPDYVSLVNGLIDMADNTVKTAADKQMLITTQAKLATFGALFTADYLLVTANERQHLQHLTTNSK
ncbi:5-bromo-4-chloroindolyl phosphate hydrolysis family protein [Loigolactobacillus zhaoyuanensis]|uniref:5-bromo-4-chloroindolyl phosphate hydrolysis family protein n=1 Tax=Loigolactobacillus zhaoyuanensis TaxID=2486017 RepID=A0ABW8UET4_9LACO